MDLLVHQMIINSPCARYKYFQIISGPTLPVSGQYSFNKFIWKSDRQQGMSSFDLNFNAKIERAVLMKDSLKKGSNKIDDRGLSHMTKGRYTCLNQFLVSKQKQILENSHLRSESWIICRTQWNTLYLLNLSFHSKGTQYHINYFCYLKMMLMKVRTYSRISLLRDLIFRGEFSFRIGNLKSQILLSSNAIVKKELSYSD